MAYKDVTVNIRVKLVVPSDGEYDEESYFNGIKKVLEIGSERIDGPEVFQDVDQLEVSLAPKSCGHSEYARGHCGEMSCDNYINKHRKLY